MKIKLFFLSIAFIALAQILPAQTRAAGIPQAPFSKGFMFTEWFEFKDDEAQPNANQINFTQITEQDFIDVKNMGADVIRLPIDFHKMLSGAPDYTIDPLLLRFLDIAIDWAEKHELYIIIENRSFDLYYADPYDLDKILIPLWTQLAQRYNDRSDYVVYEIKNEPHAITDDYYSQRIESSANQPRALTDSRWGEIQGIVINEIRKYDQKHWIVVGGTGFNSIDKLSALPRYSDKKLIYTFHFYEPDLFVNQGNFGVDINFRDLAKVPFPYDRSRMPRMPDSFRGTVLERAFENYERDSSLQGLVARLDKAANFARQRNVPVFCGEFGVNMANSPPEDRLRYYEFIADALDKLGISRTSMDYHYWDGIFNSNDQNIDEHFWGFGDVNYDLNVDLVKALGFTPPVQRIRRQETVREGFTIYDDYPNRQFVKVRYWPSDGVILLDTNAAEGEFAIRFGNVPRYKTFHFRFDTKNDFSILASEGYFLEFKARAEKPVSFDVRFVNPENASSIPWRMRYTISPSMLPSDGKWHTIRIPLNQMQEHGAWEEKAQQWLNPRREFTWKNIDRLEFASEQESLLGKYVWFDSIKIVKPDEVIADSTLSDGETLNEQLDFSVDSEASDGKPYLKYGIYAVIFIVLSAIIFLIVRKRKK